MFESEMGNPLVNVYIAIENHLKYFYGNFQEQTVKLPEGSFSFVMLPDGIDHSFDPPYQPWPMAPVQSPPRRVKVPGASDHSTLQGDASVYYIQFNIYDYICICLYNVMIMCIYYHILSIYI